MFNYNIPLTTIVPNYSVHIAITAPHRETLHTHTQSISSVIDVGTITSIVTLLQCRAEAFSLRDTPDDSEVDYNIEGLMI